MKLVDFFEDLYRPKRLFGKSQNSVRLHRHSIRSFGRTLGHEPTLADLTEANLLRHMQRVVANQRSRATANKDRAQLVAEWKLAYQMGLVETWPDVAKFPEPDRVPTAWLASDLRKLFQQISAERGTFCGIPRSLWWRTLILTCLDTGERINPVFQSRWSWLDGRWLLMPAEARKGGRRDRKYLLSQPTLDGIAKIRSLQRDAKRIFAWDRCPMYIWVLYGKLLQDAGLPHGRKDKFHRLRKTVASVVYAAGLDPQDALDHQDRRTTQAYLDPRFTRAEQPSDVLSKYLSAPVFRDQSPEQRDSA